MKKLLSILTISTSAASVPASLLANTVQTRTKCDVGSLTSNSNNDYLPLNKINEINKATAIAVDSSNNIYFATNKVSFVLKHGATTATQINGIDKSVFSLTVDNNDNVYFSLFSDYVYKLSVGSKTPTKINGIDFAAISIAVDSSNNIYFRTDKGAYVLQTALSWVKTNINVNLVDKAKKIARLRDDQLVANGQVRVKMANTNIETVKVNGAIMPSPDKNWDFDLPVDSTTVENKDYKIEIAFKVYGKSYTEQIIVSSLFAQPSITVQKNTSPFGNGASYVYQVPTNDKVG